MYGFYRVAAVVPELRVADVDFNEAEICRCALEAEKNGQEIAVFPELSLTGCTCGDLFRQNALLKQAEFSLKHLAESLRHKSLLVIAGLPVQHNGKIYNCSAWLYKGSVLMLTPRLYSGADADFGRIFSSGENLLADNESHIMPMGEIPFGNCLSGVPSNSVIPGVETGADFFCAGNPGFAQTQNRINLVLNPCAYPACMGKTSDIRELVCSRSAASHSAYVHVSAGVCESTTDGVYSGKIIIAEDGKILAENSGLSFGSEIAYADMDAESLEFSRNRDNMQTRNFSSGSVKSVSAKCVEFHGVSELKYRKVNSAPFLPETPSEQDEQYAEMYRIQCIGLARRLSVTHAKKVVIGISGGLDSTLAILAARGAFQMMNADMKNIVAVTMPGFGTTSRTKDNSVKLAELIGADLRTADIREACLHHFRDIGHDPAVLDTTYENTQARERTQILMDVANREGGLVIGTGDLSELALGWCTYNGDHMSMYAVNGGVTKSMIRGFMAWYAQKNPGPLSDVLTDVVNTPVSPELLPADAGGKIAQKTENILGSYYLHDFYLWHTMKYGASPDKIRYLAGIAFAGRFTDAEIDRTLTLFLRRFFTQQFKRSCMPDGPAVCGISLSPRGAWHMPSDASANLWLNMLPHQ